VLDRHQLAAKRHLFQAELTSEEDVGRMRAEIEGRLGPVARLVNIAGGSSNSMSWKLSLKEFNEIISTNLTSTFLCCKEFVPPMRRRNFGRIVNTSSIVATEGTIGASHYAAAKAAIAGFSKSLSLELANKNITVNTLALGYFQAGIIEQVPPAQLDDIRKSTPVGRLGDPFEAAHLIAYLLSDEASFMTGQNLHLDGGRH
jgi:NAD(P)-dependent dehydrogenase (short-subunit alcohol dehydrogenase family)